jgi:23S rRNA G2069 N7-methylase RlmK/C1962 C5-methylase RlmI
MFYFDKNNPDVLFADIRDESHILCDGRHLHVRPDEIVDFREMPYNDGSFNLVIFDPPHLHKAGSQSWLAKKYGKLDSDTWQEDISKGFNECWRVLSKGGTLIFKWNETQIKLKEVLNCFSQRPIFGHTTTHNLKTHWMVFYKLTHRKETMEG